MNVKRIDSKDENVCKYVFDFGTAVAEAVLYKYPTYQDRTVICCSTQSGCPVGCRFCGAGDYFVRNLTAREILDQVQYLFEDKNIDANSINKCQIMFMSMGEPMLNYHNLEEAIMVLDYLYPKAKLLISTSGPRVDYAPLIRLSKEIKNIGLQFSVHESSDENRNKLIPFKKKLTLSEISMIGHFFYEGTGRKPFFNYCAHADNTSIVDADRLFEKFHPNTWEATISVICEKDESIAAANQRQRKLATDFMSILMDKYGYSVRCFDPAGQDDIGGGCGQLWYVQNWMKDNFLLARPSIGNGLPSVHTPRED